jgi:hypothetical protein
MLRLAEVGTSQQRNVRYRLDAGLHRHGAKALWSPNSCKR